MRSDLQGHGEFLAPRGSHKHTGKDYACIPGSEVLSCVSGTVTKIGMCYGQGYGGAVPEGDEEIYRYVEVTDAQDRHHRFLYVSPTVDNGDYVREGDPIATAMDVSLRYPDPDKPMTPHVHYEIFVGNKSRYIDPDTL